MYTITLFALWPQHMHYNIVIGQLDKYRRLKPTCKKHVTSSSHGLMTTNVLYSPLVFS